MMRAMYCSKCGAQLVPNAAFCAKCGAAVALPPPGPPPPAPPAAPPVVQAVTPAPPAPPFPPHIFATPSATSGMVVITRPGVVTFLAVLHFIGAGFWVLIGLGAFAGTTDTGPGVIGALITGLVFVAMCVAQLFCGLGLLRLKPYGRTLQLVFAWIGLLGVPVGTIVSILILIYFFKPGIKLLFAGRPGDDFTDQELAEIKTDTASSGAMLAVIVIVAVLLAIFVIAIVAAIAVPGLLRARMSGNEATAMSTLRAINSGEVAYAASCASGGFAVSLEDLAKPPTSGGSAFISVDLGRSGVERSGYIFTLTRDESPIVGDVGTTAATCNGSSYQPASSYFASAEPVTPGTTGTRYFALDARGTIYESNNPISNPIMFSTGAVPIR